MVLEPPSYGTYSDAHDLNSIRHGRDPDTLLMTYKNSMAAGSLNGQVQMDPTFDLRYKVYTVSRHNPPLSAGARGTALLGISPQ